MKIFLTFFLGCKFFVVIWQCHFFKISHSWSHFDIGVRFMAKKEAICGIRGKVNGWEENEEGVEEEESEWVRKIERITGGKRCKETAVLCWVNGISFGKKFITDFTLFFCKSKCDGIPQYSIIRHISFLLYHTIIRIYAQLSSHERWWWWVYNREVQWNAFNYWRGYRGGSSLNTYQFIVMFGGFFLSYIYIKANHFTNIINEINFLSSVAPF